MKKTTQGSANTIALKSYCQLFLVSIIFHSPKQEMCVLNMYVCVIYITFVWMVLIKSHGQWDIIQLPPVGASVSGCSLDPSTPPHFHWKLGFLEKFMRLCHVSFILCSWAFLTEGQELWNFSFSALALIWHRLGNRENEVRKKWSYGNVLNAMRGCSRWVSNEGNAAYCLSWYNSYKVIKGGTGHTGSLSHT